MVTHIPRNLQSRRKFLKSSGVATTIGATALAGCVGGDDITTIRMATSGEGTSAYAMSQGMAAIVDEHSDSLTLDARPADGSFQAMVQMDQGEIELAYTDILNAFNIVNELESYADDPFENQIYEVIHYYDLQLGFVTTADRDIRTIADLENVRFGPGPAGSGTRLTLMEHLGHHFDDLDALDTASYGFADGGSELNEGRVEATPVMGMNGWSTPSYIEELHSINDNTMLVEWPDEVVESIREDERLGGDYYGPDDFPGPEYQGGEEWFPTTIFNLYATDAIEADVLEEMLTVLWENREELATYHALLDDYEEDFISDLTDTVPTHPGAEAFFDSI